MRKYKVLLIAELADPKMVSVPLVAWSHAEALRKVADVHIVTQVRHRNSFIEEGLVEGKDFTAIDTEKVTVPLRNLANLLSGGKGKGWTTKMALQLPSYLYFEHLVWRKFETKLKSGQYDVVHRISPVSPTLPSPIAKKLSKVGIPFVLGPIAGGLPWPKEYDHERRKEREWLSYIRGIYKLVPYYNSTRKYASAIIPASKATLQDIPKKLHEKCIYLPENAVDYRRFNITRTSRNDGVIRLIFIGRLVPYKCADVVIRAASRLLKEGVVTLDIVGDGPEKEHLKQITKSEGVDGLVSFHGNVDHKQVQNIASQCDVLAFPSIREFGGGVVLEAMALGLMPIVVDYGGPAELVTPETGIKLNLGPKKVIEQQLRKRIESLSLIEINEKGRSAQNRVEQLFTWQAKANMVVQVYNWVTGNTINKPDFGIPLK